MAFLKRFLFWLPVLLLSPLFVTISVLALAITDLAWKLFGTKRDNPAEPPIRDAASVVIPNWNGKDLLAKYLPSVIEALKGHPANEIVVVDNASTDGSADFVRKKFPQVNLVELRENLGFGGGSNAGFRAARNDIVVLLNSDMRVAPDFLAPLLEGFADPEVFAVSCQIFFSDPDSVREESGLTQGWWQDGSLRVRHRIDAAVEEMFPCFYGGGGSCAFDRVKFLELGAFDALFEPFYLEDTDLGFLAWKRGWKVLYQPRSVVYHEHRGTIGKHFNEKQIQAVLKKNFLLFCWKNIHEWRRLAPHFLFTWVGGVLTVLFGEVALRPTPGSLARAFFQLPQAMGSRWRARGLARIGDTEAFRRPLGGYFRDRFQRLAPAPERLRVLFVSPYPICPPVHGGGVFMYQTLRQMARFAEVHVVELLEYAWQERLNEEMRRFCTSVEWIVRPSEDDQSVGLLRPYAVREFFSQDLEWLIHRQIFLKRIDLVQLEYTPMAQYGGGFRQIPTALFEHDIYFQSVGRGLGHMRGAIEEMQARMEYLRALHYELHALPACDQVQVCTKANRDYLVSFVPKLASKVRYGLRAGIDTLNYGFRTWGRDPYTMLFLGSFRHDPNRVAMDWFTGEVMPLILKRQPRAKLLVAGSDPPPDHAYSDFGGALEMLGLVDDVRGPLGRYAVFVCPVLSGSGVRVKLLEAFAAGIPVVSTSVGAEGLATRDGEFCALADTPDAFAERILEVFENPNAAADMAVRARKEVEAYWDMDAITRKLVASYRELVVQKRRAISGRGSGLS
ncbi:MAG TPA: glycosyltransferase [Bryobacteraceae bacterium]|nr:glycosyltransferase [Bryobacteraceae bacterium]